MEEPTKPSNYLKLVEKSTKGVTQEATQGSEKRQKETGKLGKQSSPQKKEQQTRIVECGGSDFSHETHDVTICLVPYRTNCELLKDKPTLTKVRVHSSRLSKCSKYFETCLAVRWKKPVSSTDSSSEFVLETHGDVRHYTECFHRMYSPPFSKDFKDVHYSLGLLKAATHIQFHELMDSIALYLSSKLWSDTDEMAIRIYATRHDFPRNHAEDLVARLGMDMSKDEWHEQLCDMIEQCIQSALACDGNYRSNRAFFKEMLLGSAPGSPNGHARPCNIASNGPACGPILHPHCMRDIVTIVTREANNMVVRIAKECEGKKAYHSVPRFADKILAICWTLETLLAARVAEEFVQRFVHLHALAQILGSTDSLLTSHSHSFGANFPVGEYGAKPGEARNAALELAKLVLLIYQEVAAGNLLLKTAERVALLENWHMMLVKVLVGGKFNFDQPTKHLFMTLPLKQQMLLVKSRKDSGYESYISSSSLAKFVRKHWPVIEQDDVGCKDV
ncbi:hypothetical protein M758_7G022100 [Ceratodon purpureus]|nr:hypothetical protein M758_7G022100 [Ceratodon purpureus]KAG0609895.1 hypothetical protein M758_7G022100 [Ceratodon purpureus]KAG0609896.1 hypothetical protein M758_7G022100 [Ceratodon purpureus]